MEEMLSIRYS